MFRPRMDQAEKNHPATACHNWKRPAKRQAFCVDLINSQLIFELGQFSLADPFNFGQLVDRTERPVLGAILYDTRRQGRAHSWQSLQLLGCCLVEMNGFVSLVRGWTFYRKNGRRRRAERREDNKQDHHQ
jgi:hypothetical protein